MDMFPKTKTLLGSDVTDCGIAIVLEDWSDQSYFNHNGNYIEDKAGTGVHRLIDDHPPCLKINGRAYSQSTNIFNFPLPPDHSAVHVPVVFEDCKLNQIYTEEMDFENVGPYVLRYRSRRLWKRENTLFPVKYPSCQEGKFYIDLRDGILLPGEKRKFTVAFTSKYTGIYHEEWEFTTDPAVHLNRIIFRFSALAHNKHSHESCNILKRDLSKLQAEECVVDILDRIIRKIFQSTVIPKQPSVVHVYSEKEAFLYLNGNQYYYDEKKIINLKNFYYELTGDKWNLCVASFDDAMKSEDYIDEASLKYKQLKLQMTTPQANILARENYPEYNRIFEFLGEAITDIQNVIDYRRGEFDMKPVKQFDLPPNFYFYFPSTLKVSTVKVSTVKLDSPILSPKKLSPTTTKKEGTKAKKVENRKYIYLVHKHRDMTESTISSVRADQQTYANSVRQDVYTILLQFVDDLARELNKFSSFDYNTKYMT